MLNHLSQRTAMKLPDLVNVTSGELTPENLETNVKMDVKQQHSAWLHPLC